MLIQATSDLHGYLPETIPDGDVLVIAGDITPWDKSHAYNKQYSWMLEKFFPWLESIKSVDHIIFIGGNHDFILDPVMHTMFYNPPDERNTNPRYRQIMEKINELPDHIHYLKDSGLTIDRVKFWGTPHVPVFGGWAFMERDSDLHIRFDNIPEDTDVLISHGPPYGFGDIAHDLIGSSEEDIRGNQGEHLGSYALSSALSKRPNIQYTFFGHIHGGYGLHSDSGHGETHYMWEHPINSLMVNVAMRNDFYDLRYEDEWFTKAVL